MSSKIYYLSGLGDETFDKFCFSIENIQNEYEILEKKLNDIAYYKLKSLKTNETKEIEIVPIVWQDLIDDNKLENMNLFNRIILMLFWILDLPFLFKCLNSKNKMVYINLLINFIFLLSWYFSFFIVGGKFISDELGLNEIKGLLSLGSNFINNILNSVKRILANETIRGVLVLNSLVYMKFKNIFMKALNLIFKATTFIKFREKQALINSRIISSVEKSQEIKIVCHSFAGVVCLNSVINFFPNRFDSIKFITLGSSLEFFSYKSLKIKEDLNKLKIFLEKEEINTQWLFVYNPSDWYSPDLPSILKDLNSNNFKYLELSKEYNLFECFKGKPHFEYFYDTDTILSILEF